MKRFSGGARSLRVGALLTSMIVGLWAPGAEAESSQELEEGSPTEQVQEEAAVVPPAPITATQPLQAPGAMGTRAKDRVLLHVGIGVPDITHLQLDVGLLRSIAVTGRLSTAFFLYSAASAGITGFVPLSSDGYVIPRHALTISADVTAFYVIGFLFSADLEGTALTYNAGYSFTSDKGFHVRATVGAWGLMLGGDDWGDARLPITGRVSIGALF